MNYIILMSMLAGKAATYKVGSVAINGSTTGLATVPSFYFTGGGLTDGDARGASGYFNYTTNGDYYYNTGYYYAYSDYYGTASLGITKGTTVNTTSGSIMYGSATLGTFTATTKSIAVSGGGLATVTITNGGEYRVSTPGGPWDASRPLANGTYSYNFLPNGSIFGGGPIGTCDITFTNGVVTSVGSIVAYAGPFTDGASSSFIGSDGLYQGTGGTIYVTNAATVNFASVTYTRTPIVYTYPITVDSTSATAQLLTTPGPITVTYGGTSATVTLAADQAYQPTYYNLTSVTLIGAGSGYISAPTVTCTNAGTLLTANMVLE